MIFKLLLGFLFMMLVLAFVLPGAQTSDDVLNIVTFGLIVGSIAILVADEIEAGFSSRRNHHYDSHHHHTHKYLNAHNRRVSYGKNTR